MTDWQALLDGQGEMVWRTVYRLLNHHADASDCYQETFLAYVKLSRRQPIDDPGAMLRTIATARALDRLRRRIHERRSSSTMDLESLHSRKSDPSSSAQGSELAEQLRGALLELPDKQAQAHCLRFIEEMSYEQIASTMNITVDSVGVLLHRARARLREMLIEHGPQDEVSHERQSPGSSR